jgi:diguanylate cyclase (GGDEF)-like protein
MQPDRPHRRVLVVADSPEAALPRLFDAEPLAHYEPVPAESLSAAHFALQHNPCDLLLIDEPVYRREGAEPFAWLARRHRLPSVVLTEPTPEAARLAYRHGAGVWLPRGLALEAPELLATALERAGGAAEVQRGARKADESLRMSRRQVDRLVALLWRTLPLDVERRWLSQRHMLERLQEEVSRTQRYGIDLTVALGEVEADEEAWTSSGVAVGDWTADRVARGKRRCDVAGQYGLRGFILLLVNTPPCGGEVCCRRLQTALEDGAPGPGPLRVSFGMASLSADPGNAESLLRTAEDRLEAAKAGTNERLVYS